jgi:hypothetical protein
MIAPVVITGQVVGAEMVVRRLGLTAQVEARTRMRRTVATLGFSLENKVKFEFLAGRALQHRSGRLMRSVNMRVDETHGGAVASVGTSLKYGRAWELGFDVPERDIFPRRGQALFWPGASHPVRKVHQNARHQAARPFLKPALDEMRPLIHAALADALRGL